MLTLLSGGVLGANGNHAAAPQIKEALTWVSASLVNWVTAVAAVAAAAAAG
jgi:hypothetical protein